MKISINEPCHANWDKMTPNDKGAFCLSCQKNVVDFSNKTIYQIKEFFSNLSEPENGSICGRFEEEQLTEMSFDHFFDQFKKWKYFQKFALITFFVFGFSLFGYGQDHNNNPKEVIMGKVAYVPIDTTKKCAKDTTHKAPVKGRVKSTSNKPKQKSDPNHTKLMGDVDITRDEKKK